MQLARKVRGPEVASGTGWFHADQVGHIHPFNYLSGVERLYTVKFNGCSNVKNVGLLCGTVFC